jgi:hypothetical protein
MILLVECPQQFVGFIAFPYSTLCKTKQWVSLTPTDMISLSLSPNATDWMPF